MIPGSTSRSLDRPIGEIISLQVRDRPTRSLWPKIYVSGLQGFGVRLYRYWWKACRGPGLALHPALTPYVHSTTLKALHIELTQNAEVSQAKQ